MLLRYEVIAISCVFRNLHSKDDSVVLLDDTHDDDVEYISSDDDDEEQSWQGTHHGLFLLSWIALCRDYSPADICVPRKYRQTSADIFRLIE